EKKKRKKEESVIVAALDSPFSVREVQPMKAQRPALLLMVFGEHTRPEDAPANGGPSRAGSTTARGNRTAAPDGGWPAQKAPLQSGLSRGRPDSGTGAISGGKAVTARPTGGLQLLFRLGWTRGSRPGVAGGPHP
ncbi:hypothetical protein IscW_ISCW002596, partial [Ixodes scapularis]